MILAEAAAGLMPEMPIMDFRTHEIMRRGLMAQFGMVASGLELAAAASRIVVNTMPFNPFAPALILAAGFEEASAAFLRHYTRDEKLIPLDFSNMTVNGAPIKISEECVHRTPFGRVMHLKRETPDGKSLDRKDPPMLVFVPHSGHTASLTQDFISGFARDHDVYYVELENANEIPKHHGDFGYHDAIDFYRDSIVQTHHHAARNGHEGRVHTTFICQPGPPGFIAAMLLARENAPERPASITALGSPFDTRKSPTVVNKFAAEHSMPWFERNVVHAVPEGFGYAGEGRPVYPGYIQRMAFVGKNLDGHCRKVTELFGHMVRDDRDKVSKQDKFDEVFLFDIASLPKDFYLETVRYGFKEHLLARGLFSHRGILITGAENLDIPVFAIEGEKDDITGLGQCEAMLHMCSRLPGGLKRHFIIPEAGHYGIFAGSGLRAHSLPRITSFIRDANTGLYSQPAAENIPKRPESGVSKLELAA